MQIKKTLFLFSYTLCIHFSIHGIDQELGRDLIENAIARQQISAEHFFSPSVSFLSNFLGAFEHEGNWYLFLDGEDENVRDKHFTPPSGLTSAAYLDKRFDLRPYLLIKLSKEDIDYLLSSLHRKSELFKISSQIRDQDTFTTQVDRIFVNLMRDEDEVMIMEYQLSRDIKTSRFVEDQVGELLKSMRINDFEIFTYIIATFNAAHSNLEALQSWSEFFEEKLDSLD